MSEPGLLGVDTHCHVDLYPDPAAELRESRASQFGVVAVTNTPSVFQHMVGFATGHRSVYPALGLHPELAAQRAGELALFRELAPDATFIGEVGLDGTSEDVSARRKQREVFSAILNTCRQLGGKVLSVHSRRAAAEVVELIGPAFPGAVILHWFSGSHSVARLALERGMYFSVNTAMLRSVAGAKLVAMLPRDRVLTETDGPFVKVGGRAAKPTDVNTCVRDLATLWNITAEEAGQTVVSTFNRCVQMAHLHT